MFRVSGCLLVLLGAVSIRVAAQAPTQRQEVQNFVRAYADAANRGDVTSYVEMYSRRADLIAVNDGELVRGWDKVRDGANAILGLEGSYKISVGTIDVISLGTTRAIAVFPFVMTVTTQQGSVQLPGATTFVLEKSSQGWKIIHDHTSTAPTEEGSGEADNEQAFLAAMKSDLRNVVTAEEAYFADSVKYTRSLQAMHFHPTAGVTLVVVLTSDGYNAAAKHVRAPGWACAIYVGSVRTYPQVQKEGQPVCWQV